MGKVARTMRKARSKVKGRAKGKRTKVKRGKKKKTKGKKPSSAWNKHMMVVYRSMKAKNSSVKLGDAMKVAKKTYKKASTNPSKQSKTRSNRAVSAP